MEKRKKIKELQIKPAAFFYHISQIYMYLIALELFVISVLFLCGKTINWYLLPACFALAILALFIFYDDEAGEQFVMETAVSILLLLFLTYISGRICDMSWDGNAYHKATVGLLRYHWNPLRESPEGNFALQVLGTDLEGMTLWTEAYPKASEIFAASVYILTGNIESGKVYTLLAMFCAFGITYFFLRKHEKGIVFSLVFSAAASMNPIAVQQLDTYYVDGFLHLMLYITVISLIMNMESNQVTDEKISFSMVAAGIMTCSNIKFTGLAFCGIYCLAYYLFWCMTSWCKDRKKWFQVVLKRGIKYAVLACVSLFSAGGVYVTNAVRHGHLFYPLLGDEKVNFLENLSQFPEFNRIQMFFTSIFSKITLQRYSDLSQQLKWPFFIYPEELGYMGTYDAGFSAYGVWFSGLFVIGITIIIYNLYRMKKNRVFCFWLMNLLLIILLCVLIKESWYARYAPYVYFIALIGLYFVFDQNIFQKGNCFGGALGLLFLINSGLFLKDIPKEVRVSNEICSNIDALRQYECVEIDYTSFGGYFPGICFNLIDRRVNYKVKLDLSESGNYYILHEVPWYVALIWLPETEGE